MQKFLSWFGFINTAIGVPPTDRQVRANRLATLKIAAALGFGCLLLLASCVDWTPMAANPWSSLLLLIYPVMIGALVMGPTGAYDMTSLSAIPVHHCPQVESWADAYPEIRAHIVAINQQPRQLAMCDYHFMHTWVLEREVEGRTREAQQACKALHKIGTP